MTDDITSHPTGVNGEILSLDEQDREALHLTDPDARLDPAVEDGEVDAVHVARFGQLEDLIDGFAEAFCAHDLERCIDLLAPEAELPGLGGDRTGFRGAVEDVWDRRPNAVLVRGLVDDQPVGVVWDVCDHEDHASGACWTRVAVLFFELGDTDGQLGLVEVVDDSAALDQAEAPEPEHDLAEGARWSEWYEGEDGG